MPIAHLRRSLGPLQSSLINHPLYGQVNSMNRLRRFMEVHVYAVWDFMSLAKRLQRDLTSVETPWLPPPSPTLARFINEVVMAEESDQGPDGEALSHLDLYVAAMEEVGASTVSIRHFIDGLRDGVEIEEAFLYANTPLPAMNFSRQTIDLALHGETCEVAASFLFGREDIIPAMFEKLLRKEGEEKALWFQYYLERHIELDGDEHGPLAEKLLLELIGVDRANLIKAEKAAERSIRSRIQLWDAVLDILPAEALSGSTSGSSTPRL